MLGLRLRAKGELQSLACVELPQPQPGVGEALVRVHAASINPSDFKNAQGAFPVTTYPRIPGRDYAGVVASAPGAAEWTGRAVWGGGGALGFTRDGAHAQYVVVPLASLRAKPEPLSMRQAACALSFITAYSALIDAAGLRPGEWALITGARGAVGAAAMQIAGWAGARAIGIDRDNAARMAALAQQNTAGRGVDVVLDCVGGAMFEPAQRTLGAGGRQVCITSVGDRQVRFDLLDFYHRRLTLRGVDTVAMDEMACAGILERLAPGFAAGALRGPAIGRVCTLAEAADAYRDLAAGKGAGKTVIVMHDPGAI